MPLTGIAACVLLFRIAGDAAPDPTPPARAKAGIRMTFVFDAAKATLGTLAGEKGADPSEIAKLPGNVLLVKHQRRFDPNATEERFAEQLRAAASGRKLVPDTFAWNRTVDRLAETRALLARIEEDPELLSEAIRARIARFTPPNQEFPVTVYFIAGGTSDGFAEGDSFCIALDYFRGDDAGLQVLMAHELFHVAYRTAAAAGWKSAAKGKAAKPSPAAERVLPILEETMNEGIASRVGDPTAAAGGKSWVEWFRGKFERNFERLDSSFVLFDTILYRASHDEKAPTEQLYRIGFTGSWDSALYFVGYEMARVIEEEEGPAAIPRLIPEPPLRFFERYVAISRSRPDRVKYRFAAVTEEILARLASAGNR
jgi:hypothetical protein